MKRLLVLLGLGMACKQEPAPTPTAASSEPAVSGGPSSSASLPSGHLVRMGAVTVTGRLPLEVVQHTVRRNFARFRQCYDDGLRSNPSLHGSVTTKLVVATDGSVASSQDGGSDVPDQAVVTCINHAFTTMTFPPLEGGTVTVVVPIVLT